MKESVQRAFAYIQGQKVDMGIAEAFDRTEFHVEAADLLGSRIPCECGVALLVAVYSALKKQPAQPALVVLGDLSIQGVIKPLRSPAEALQMALEKRCPPGADSGGEQAKLPGCLRRDSWNAWIPSSTGTRSPPP